MKKNEDLQKDVQEAIKWEPLLNAAEIGVTAKNGIINLTGTVDSYSKKLAAEEAAKSVSGVKAVVEEIKINYGVYNKTGDNEIAKEVVNALKWNFEVPNEKVKVKVENGWVNLDGELEWNFQREAARNAVKNLVGIQGVTNNIKIKSEMDDEIEKRAIQRAFARNWSIDDRAIKIKVSGNRVILNGIVHSLYQKDEAERIAWNAPGVYAVENDLIID